MELYSKLNAQTIKTKVRNKSTDYSSEVKRMLETFWVENNTIRENMETEYENMQKQIKKILDLTEEEK